MPGSPLKYYRALRPSSFVECALGLRCLRVEQRHHHSRQVIDAWLDERWSKPVQRTEHSFVEGRAKVVLDPATMRLASADAKRTVHAVRLAGRERVTTTTYEQLRHSFSYP